VARQGHGRKLPQASPRRAKLGSVEQEVSPNDDKLRRIWPFCNVRGGPRSETVAAWLGGVWAPSRARDLLACGRLGQAGKLGERLPKEDLNIRHVICSDLLIGITISQDLDSVSPQALVPVEPGQEA